MQQVDTWVLIADSSSAAIAATDWRLKHGELVREFSHPESRVKGLDIMADDRGRTRVRNKDSVRGAAMEYKTTPHEVEAAAFSRELAEFLRLSRANNEWENLVLVAPPNFLGQLRDSLDGNTLGKVRASVAKNYRNDKLEAALEKVRSEMDLP